MVETPGEGFWDPERCRDDVPGPMFVPWCYVPPVLVGDLSKEENSSFICVHCRFFFFVKNADATSWPLCDICGLSFTLVATGHLPFATATEEDDCCYLCFQHQPLEKKACTLCNALLKKAIAGDNRARSLLLEEDYGSRNTFTHPAPYYPFGSQREYDEVARENQNLLAALEAVVVHPRGCKQLDCEEPHWPQHNVIDEELAARVQAASL